MLASTLGKYKIFFLNLVITKFDTSAKIRYKEVRFLFFTFQVIFFPLPRASDTYRVWKYELQKFITMRKHGWLCHKWKSEPDLLTASAKAYVCSLCLPSEVFSLFITLHISFCRFAVCILLQNATRNWCPLHSHTFEEYKKIILLEKYFCTSLCTCETLGGSNILDDIC